MFHYDDYTDAYLKTAIQTDFGYDIEDISTMVIFFYLPDENGSLHPHWQALATMSNVWFMSFTSMFCVGYCGINCYRSISRALAVTQTQSKAAKTLQHQLFNALVIQTLIPSVLMYLPLFFVFALPIFGINIPYASSCISATISLYTAIDPLPSMFIIKTYRKAIIKVVIKVLLLFTSPPPDKAPRVPSSTVPD
ncbi:hypothetical protein GCK72_025806 [Caenorhabditis remanei]|uniref:G protein-coupled receptor n=1 Tax=Caenorhabditis remanei TaxID=31234 RepID=A0A6A5G4C0_CAERE|nr:hypothetical protein GCK72_025806 [Caenorhabditis remanei]KAF1749339.1 hypothetical protein GCK72_025806 [Caenorhabditis remanei]